MTKQTESWTILKVLTWTKEYLGQKGVENARLESEWLLCEVLGLDRVKLYVNFDKPLSAAELADLRGLVVRRARREPLQYILGTQEFMGLEFAVSPAVLIPRHDTEVLVVETLKRAASGSRILDIGVGSGCVAVALAKQLPDAEVSGGEESAEALAVAERNATRHGVVIRFKQGSLFAPFPGERFDLIVSNPPYIPTAELDGLQPEVRDFEPRKALDGGADGLDFYRHIISAASDHLSSGGWLLFEVGIGQAEQVLGFFAETGKYTGLFTAKDPAGIERVAGGRSL